MEVFFLSEQLAPSKIVANNLVLSRFGAAATLCGYRDAPTRLGCSHLFRKYKYDIKTLKLWRLQHYNALLDDLEAEARLHDGRTSGPQTDKQSFRTFDTRLISGRVCSAYLNLTNQTRDGVLLPTDLCTKTGCPVLDILPSKHPAMREPPTLGTPDSVFEPYPSIPEVVPMAVTSDIVK